LETIGAKIMFPSKSPKPGLVGPRKGRAPKSADHRLAQASVFLCAVLYRSARREPKQWLPKPLKASICPVYKSMASHLLRAGGNAPSALDHVNAATTSKYLDPRIVETASPAESLFNPIGGGT
jgi:hypothetical protein